MSQLVGQRAHLSRLVDPEQCIWKLMAIGLFDTEPLSQGNANVQRISVWLPEQFADLAATSRRTAAMMYWYRAGHGAVGPAP